MISSSQKIKDIDWFFPVKLLIKILFNRIAQETQPEPHFAKSGNLLCYLPLMINSM